MKTYTVSTWSLDSFGKQQPPNENSNLSCPRSQLCFWLWWSPSASDLCSCWAPWISLPFRWAPGRPVLSERTGVLFGTTSSRVHCNSGQVKTPKSDIWNSQNHHSYCNQWVVYSSDNVSSQLKGFDMHRGNHSRRCRHPTHSRKKAWATWLPWEAVRQAKTYQSKNLYQKLCYLGMFQINVKIITYHKLIWWK